VDVSGLLGGNMHKVGMHNEANRAEWLEKILSLIPEGSRILDAGAGEQQFRKYCTHLQYVAQDFAQYDGTGDGSGLQMGSWDQAKLDIISDITSIPEPDSSFDAILCSEVLEHLPSPIEAIAEFSRLLKTGGYLILTAPFCSLTHFAPYHYSTGFNTYFYQKHLTENKFEILEIKTNGNFIEFVAQELRRVETVASTYAKTKRLSLLEKIVIRSLLNLLSRLSNRDKGSSELLCFGYQVFAKKSE
jgi:SAM-dependent methyltransferase